MEKNLGPIPLKDRWFYQQTKDFVDKLKIYRRIHEVLGGVTPSPLHPPLATHLLTTHTNITLELSN